MPVSSDCNVHHLSASLALLPVKTEVVFSYVDLLREMYLMHCLGYFCFW